MFVIIEDDWGTHSPLLVGILWLGDRVGWLRPHILVRRHIWDGNSGREGRLGIVLDVIGGVKSLRRIVRILCGVIGFEGSREFFFLEFVLLHSGYNSNNKDKFY